MTLQQSMGRGGLGNIVMTDPVYQEETEELVRNTPVEYAVLIILLLSPQIAQKANEMIQRQRELKAAKRVSLLVSFHRFWSNGRIVAINWSWRYGKHRSKSDCYPRVQKATNPATPGSNSGQTCES